MYLASRGLLIVLIWRRAALTTLLSSGMHTSSQVCVWSIATQCFSVFWASRLLICLQEGHPAPPALSKYFPGDPWGTSG